MNIRENRTEDYLGQPVRFFQVENDQGAKTTVMSYGATLVSLYVPDRRGRLDDVVLGFDSLAGYLGQRSTRELTERFVLGKQTRKM